VKLGRGNFNPKFGGTPWNLGNPYYVLKFLTSREGIYEIGGTYARGNFNPKFGGRVLISYENS
jgi:hypothetical protein